MKLHSTVRCVTAKKQDDLPWPRTVGVVRAEKRHSAAVLARWLHGCRQCDIVEFVEYQPVDHILKPFDRYVACSLERRLDGGERVEVN